MANKYLTSESLTLIWAKIKNAFTPKHDGVEGVVANRYGVCDTASSTVGKTATITAGDFVLETGATVFIKFNNLNTATNPTLNINDTGAKPIKRTNSLAAGSTANDSWYGGTVVPFTYDGTNWVMHHSWDENTQYVPAGLGFGYGQCSTAEATLAKTASISGYKLVTGGTATVKFQYAVPASSTLNISSRGAKNIFYRGAAITGGVIKAGDVATFIFDGTQYHLIGLDRLEKDIGNLSTLETENKTSLVDAINEQSQQIDDLRKRTRKNITNNLANLTAAITERNLQKYGYDIGDYFTAGGYQYTLADLNTFYGEYTSYGVVNINHVAIVVDTNQNVPWNTSASTETGYVGSNLHAYLTDTVLPNVKSHIQTLFGDSWDNHLIKHSKLYRNGNGRWGWAWTHNQYISALTSVQIHGSPICDMDGGTDTGEGNKPLEVFQKFFFSEIFGNHNTWLRSVSAAGCPCCADGAGNVAGDSGASNPRGAVGLIIFK